MKFTILLSVILAKLKARIRLSTTVYLFKPKKHYCDIHNTLIITHCPLKIS